MRAVVLAAGRGERLRPLTDMIPKPLVPVADVPVIEHVIAGWREAGVGRFVVVTGYLGHAIRRLFGDGSRWGIEIEYAHQDGYHGTAHALRAALSLVGEEGCFCCAADCFGSPENYGRVVEAWQSHGDERTAVMGVDWQHDLADKGAVMLGYDPVPVAPVFDIVEKPGAGAGAGWNNASLMALPPVFLSYLSERVPLDGAAGEYHLSEVVASYRRDGGLVVAFRVISPWIDIGRWQALAAAGRAARDGVVPVRSLEPVAA